MTPYARGAVAQGNSPFDNQARSYDALLVLSFGGPEGMDDVMPFLENVLRGRNVPHERMIEVAHHYEQFGGLSPLNAQNRALIAALEADFAQHGLELPIYFGNRNWHPLLPDTLQQMQADGVKNALCFFTSMFSCYSGCRQYRENLYDALAPLGEAAPKVDRLRLGFNHPLFIEANAAHLREALSHFDAPAQVHVAFTAHSIPTAMAERSAYEAQLQEAARLVAESAGVGDWALVYQSRSGSPQIPWLEPDILDHLQALKQQGREALIILPLGFISDHMEVLFDLDTEAKALAAELGMRMLRASSVGTHPQFVAMIRELVLERMAENPSRPTSGSLPPNHDVCPINCCLPR